MSQPPLNNLPFVNYNFFRVLFSKVSEADIITLFTNLLLERSLLIVSEDLQDLLPIAISLQSLLYPFQWI